MNFNSVERACFAGHAVWGEQFTPQQEAEWYEAEARAYRELNYADSSADSRTYPYHMQNVLFGFSKINLQPGSIAAGIGSAHGLEFQPVSDLLRQIFICEPDTKYHQQEIFGVPAIYSQPGSNGTFEISSNSVDLVTCFGVLHHICKPSRTIHEIARIMRNGAFALVREPIVSMGDWRFPRNGLTKNERGIPLRLFHSMIEDAGLELQCSKLISHRLLTILNERLGMRLPENLNTKLDSLLCRPYRTVTYHRTTKIQKLTPTSAFLVLRKP